MFFSETILLTRVVSITILTITTIHPQLSQRDLVWIVASQYKMLEKKPQRVQDQKHVNVFWYKKQQTLRLNVYTDVLKSKRS